MSDPVPSVCILLRQAGGVRKAGKVGKPRKHQYISKGELLAEIPKNEQIKQEEGTPPHNYCVLYDPDVTLYDNGTNVAPLLGAEGDYLEGIKDPVKRLIEYQREGRMQWIMDLKLGDEVFFRLEKGSQATLFPRGRVKHCGRIKGERGVMFGIEITDPEHRSKGTTYGHPHFQCTDKSGVYVSMDKIIKRVEGRAPNREDETIIEHEPKGGPPSQNTRSKTAEERDKEGWFDKAVSFFGGGAQPANTTAKGRAGSPSQYKFSPGDRVVVQTVKGKSVTGTVRWVGPIRAAGNVDVPVVVGMETDKPVDPAKDFPDLHVDATGSHGQELFQVSSNHTRLFLPEALVVYTDQYKKQKQEDNSFEAKEAKKWGLSVYEYRIQRDMMRKAEAVKQKEIDNIVKKHEKQHDQNEEHGVAGVGLHNDDNDDPLPELKPDQSVGGQLPQERVQREKEELNKLERENQFKRQGSRDQELYQHPTDQQPPAADRSREEEQQQQQHQPASLSPPVVERKYNQSINPSHSPQQHPHANPTTHSQQNYHPDARHLPEGRQLQEYSLHPSGDNLTLPTVSSDPSQFTVSTMVRVEAHEGHPYYGIIKWIGTLPDYSGYFAGVELDQYLEGCSDGSFEGVHYFSCPPGRGLFCLLKALQLDQRYLEPNQVPAAKRQDYPNPLAGKVPVSDDNDTPGDPGLFSKYIGDEHGIQGHHNSCYLDATVFGLFALSDSFDMMLLEEPETEIGQKIKRILWKGIVNPLRKYGVARYESIMMLRNELENLGRMKGANTDEKDPEEFLNMLFKEILRVDPFISIKRPFGVEKEFFVQLFFEIDPNQSTLPKTEYLIRKMFDEQQISFTSVPSKLLLQMPRFGKEFKMYNKIIPSLELDVKPLLDPASRGEQKCHLCKNLTGTICCSTCATDLFRTEDSPVFLCKDCSDRIHKNRLNHKFEEVKIKRPMADVSMFSRMQLLSVVCIETSHYVCFTRTNDRWLFHDSMANRLYDMYNIPRVTEVSNELNHWVYNPDNHQKLMQAPSREVPECVRRFTQDIYMCVYINPDLERYGPLPSDVDNPQSPMNECGPASRGN